MIYEHQINWAYVYNNNLDDVAVWLVWKGPIDLLFMILSPTHMKGTIHFIYDVRL